MLSGDGADLMYVRTRYRDIDLTIDDELSADDDRHE
jgi:hypothetical protein